MRVLLYGDIDLNLIDGSAIWLTSMGEVLCRAGAEVTVLLRTPLTRDVVVRDLVARGGVTLIDCWNEPRTGPAPVLSDEARIRRRLQPPEAAAALVTLGRQWNADIYLVRSLETAALLAEEPGVASRLWVYVTDPRGQAEGAGRERLRTLARRAAVVMCQTTEAQDELARIAGPECGVRMVVVPPMIPPLRDSERPPPDPSAPRLGYSGKLSPPYMIIETLDAFDRVRASHPGAEFHVVGDKFHNRPAVEGFEDTVRRRLCSTPGVIWHGGRTRAETAALLDRVDIAISWRSDAFDDSLEMSTKVLEYAGLGIPVLLNPSLVQRRLFGATYPGYVTTADDVVRAVDTLARERDMYVAASRSMREVAAAHTFDRIAEELKPVLNGSPATLRRGHATGRAVRILFAGHDLRFLQPIIHGLRREPAYELLFDEYSGHTIRDEAQSATLLGQADVVFCEWCLGNAVWYSRHVGSGQRLIVRLHLQERGLPYLDQVDWDRVDRLIFIAPRIMRECLERHPHLAAKSALIYNAIDCATLDRPKLPGAEFNVGLIGINPRRKRPDLAVDILEAMRSQDRRYTLVVKSQPPWEHEWLWRQPDEREYYEALYARIREARDVNAIVFDRPGADVPQWLTKIGVMLSTSDFEGSHQAVAEGMASGAVPAIRAWPATELYPADYSFEDAAGAATLIRHFTPEPLRHRDVCRRYARERFDAEQIVRQFRRLFDSLTGGPDADATAADLGVHAVAELRALPE